jgi:type 1 glutamine amidotransferase
VRSNESRYDIRMNQQLRDQLEDEFQALEAEYQRLLNGQFHPWVDPAEREIAILEAQDSIEHEIGMLDFGSSNGGD